MAKRMNQETELDLTFQVRIKMFGKMPKHADDAGKTLARLCALNFNNAEVKRGNTVYSHELQTHDDEDGWGPLAKVDSETTRV